MVLADGNYVKMSHFAMTGVMEFVIGTSIEDDEVEAILDGGVLRIIVNGAVKYATTQFNLIVKNKC